MLALLILLAPPFWEARPPSAWTDEEIRQLLTDSPWAQEATAAHGDGGVPVYLATARPVQEAEAGLIRRNHAPSPGEDTVSEEYRKFLRDNQGSVIVLAVRLPGGRALTEEAEIRRMEKESVLRIGRRKYRLTGHFPPAPTDPCLRLVFPREVDPQDQALRFELYLPGLPSPYRWAEFRLREMRYRGEPTF